MRYTVHRQRVGVVERERFWRSSSLYLRRVELQPGRYLRIWLIVGESEILGVHIHVADPSSADRRRRVIEGDKIAWVWLLKVRLEVDYVGGR